MKTVFTEPVFQGLELTAQGRAELNQNIQELEASFTWCTACLAEATARLNYCLAIPNCKPEKLREAQNYVAACQRGLHKISRCRGILYGELYSQPEYQPSYHRAN